MGRYKGKSEKEEEEEMVVNAKIRGRATTEGRRMKMTTTKTKKKKKVSASMTTPYNVYNLRSRRRKRSHNSTETTAFGKAANCSSCNSNNSEVIVNSSDSQASCCSSNIASNLFELTQNSPSTSSEIVQDLEVESGGGETSSKFLDGNKSVSEIETSKLHESKSDGVDYPTMKPAVEMKSMMMMPSEFEIEEFFSSAEKDLHKHFSDKYNFDVVKDVPLEGRYEWVEIKP